MITKIIFDFSRVLLFPKDDKYIGGLNELYETIQKDHLFNFFDYFTLNQPLLEFIKGTQKSYSFYIFTSEHIQKNPQVLKEIKGFFNEIFSAADLNLQKDASDSYTFLAKKISTDPQNILFIDDNIDNIQAAHTANVSTIRFTSNKQLLKDLSALLTKA